MVKSMSRYALRLCLPLVAIGSLVFLVGWFWLGWGHVTANSDLLESLPIPPGAEQIWVGSNGYTSDESPITPRTDGAPLPRTLRLPVLPGRKLLISIFLVSPPLGNPA